MKIIIDDKTLKFLESKKVNELEVWVKGCSS